MANSDKKQAALDALKDIIDSRVEQPEGPEGPKGPIIFDDPRLDKPQSKSNKNKPQPQQPQGNKPQKSDKKDDDKKDKQPQLGDLPDDDIMKKEEEERKKNAMFDDAGNKIGTEEANNATKDDVDARIKDLKDMMKNPAMIRDIEHDTQSAVRKQSKEKQAKEAERYRNSPLNRFKESFIGFIKKQIADQRGPSWSRINKKYSHSGILKPGTTRHAPSQIPAINVYFDQSASWDDEKIKVGQQAVATLNQYVKQGLIKIYLYYFSCNVHEKASDARAEGGTYGRPIIEHIKQTKPDNVIIMTDGDISDVRETVSIPGGVWFLFKGGYSENIHEHVVGKRLTKAFEI